MYTNNNNIRTRVCNSKFR